MPLTTVLFDLDGTLLPMDQDAFVKYYFGLLAQELAPHGYDPERLIRGVLLGTEAMVKNDGARINEEVFWETFTAWYGEEEKVRRDHALFDAFYRTDFQRARSLCGRDPKAAGTVAALRAMGLRVALATNPIFPAVATESRIRWAGLEPEDFELYTTYENSRFCKPNPDYFRAVTDQMGVAPEECLMVGNDATEDLAARELGMRVFLLTKCLINREGRDISSCPQGDFDRLLDYAAACLRGEN